MSIFTPAAEGHACVPKRTSAAATAFGHGWPERALWIKGTQWKDNTVPGSSAVRPETSMRQRLAGMSPHWGVK